MRSASGHLSVQRRVGTGEVSRWQAVRRLLVVRLDNLGDVLMCTPALAALRLALPDAHLSLLASPSGTALVPHLPEVDEVIGCSASWVKSAASGNGPAAGLDDAATLGRLQAGRFDAAIIFTSATQSALPAALLCRLAGIPLRLAHSRENPYELLSDWAPEVDALDSGMRHEVLRQLELIGQVGFGPGAAAAGIPASTSLSFAVREADRQQVQQVLARAWPGRGRPYVVVHPGATAASRRYPAERFGEAMDEVVDAGWTCIFAGGPDDAPLVQRARQAMRRASLDLSAQLTLGGLAALIEDADLLVSNNSGPAHLAAAVGTPVVCLYALTNPQHTPWGVPNRVLYEDVPCRNCLRSVCPQQHHLCLLGVPAERVTEAALDLLMRRLRVTCWR